MRKNAYLPCKGLGNQAINVYTRCFVIDEIEEKSCYRNSVNVLSSQIKIVLAFQLPILRVSQLLYLVYNFPSCVLLPTDVA
jgi:hypothetical protein